MPHDVVDDLILARWFGFMSNNFEEFSGTALIRNRVCRTAYTLDGMQPVVCTHIGDQPLYYIDDMDIEEEEFLDSLDFCFLERESQILGEEIADLDFLMSDNTAQSLSLFSENAEGLSIDFSSVGKKHDACIDQIKDILSTSRLASAYLNVAEKNGVSFLVSRQVEKVFYDSKARLVIINPDMDLDDQILLVSRELRRHWQHHQNVLFNPLIFHPEDAILFHRIQEADLVVSVIRIAWELQLAGFKDVWERVEHSSMMDLARAFAREAFIDFRTLNNGVANAAVFEAWFLSERCREQDKIIIQAMLADYKGYIFENGDLSRHVTAELISSLGSMPFGKNYLSIHADIIMEDPVFTEVRDRSNANFLWFIKFECSFKETEQYLQIESDLSTHGVRHDLSEEESQDQNDGFRQAADIIQLFEHGVEDTEKGCCTMFFSRHQPEGSGGENTADIIDLQFWSSRR